MEEKCRRKRQMLQRKAVNNDQITGVPPSANEVLRLPGWPLEQATRSIFNPYFGHDFSRVRVHNDNEPGCSAEAIGFRPFALGAHELVQTVHQEAVEELQPSFLVKKPFRESRTSDDQEESKVPQAREHNEEASAQKAIVRLAASAKDVGRLTRQWGGRRPAAG
jgi:hypothetical protein